MGTTVLVDAWHLSGASSQRGIGTVLRNLFPLLAREADLAVVALADRGADLPAGVERVPLRRIAPARFAQREHDARLRHDLARAARRVRADVVLSPADNPPRRSPVPWVQVLHDLIPLVLPDRSVGAERTRWERIGGRVRDADLVVAVSQHTASDAERVLGIDAARLRVAPLGVGAPFGPVDPRPRPDPPRLLYVGEYGPHKGFAEAFAVIGALAGRGLPHRLTMVGYLAPWHAAAVHKLLTGSPRPDRVDLAGYVDDIAAAYQGADAVIVTSRYEGFCLPALEAMACGTPVVAFANSAVTELVDGGGTLVADGDVAAMTDAVERLLRDPHTWRASSESGIAHARPYTWARCAAVHAAALRAAASGGA